MKSLTRTTQIALRIIRIAPRYFRLQLKNFRITLQLLFMQGLIRFNLARKSLFLFRNRLRMRLSLFHCKRQLIAKHGRDWRLCVLDDEVIQFLKVEKYVHKQMEYRGFTLNDLKGRIQAIKAQTRQCLNLNFLFQASWQLKFFLSVRDDAYTDGC
jgi:hypothetical protein